VATFPGVEDSGHAGGAITGVEEGCIVTVQRVKERDDLVEVGLAGGLHGGSSADVVEGVLGINGRDTPGWLGLEESADLGDALSHAMGDEAELHRA
jgi:hypothetical protein